MAPRLSGQNSIFGVVFFVSKSLLGIEGQKKLEKFAILTRKPRNHARILIYRTWPIDHSRDVQYQRSTRLSTYFLEYGRHVARLRRRRAYAPASNTASHDNHEKISS